MAFLTKSPPWAQYGAVARMRGRMLVNSLRTRRGKFELGAGLFTAGFFLLIWLLAGLGLGVAAWHFVSGNQLEMLALLLWPVLLVWQTLPAIAASFQEHVDLSFLLRFPISFSSYVLLYLFFDLFEVSSLLGGVALLGIWIGTVTARPDLALWTALVFTMFGAFNVLLTRMIFAWIDRWIAQRRTREILGILILFCFLGLQALNPAFHRRAGGTLRRPLTLLSAEHATERLQKPLPPALAANAIAFMGEGHAMQAAAPLGGLVLYSLAAGALLGIRLRKEYRGESLGEAPGTVERTLRNPEPAPKAPAGAFRFENSRPIAAVMEKELRYLPRSGAMLYSLAAPLVLLFLFGGASRAGHEYAAHYALPLGVAYGFLGLTRLIGNSLGGEGAGIQLYFLSPTPFRTVMLAKNLLQIGLFGVELILVCVIVGLRFGFPGPLIIAVTVCWLLFALPVQLAVGNILSISMAYRMTLTRFSRESGSMGNGLLSLLTQLLVCAVGAGIFFSFAHFGHAGLAIPALLGLAIVAFAAWFRGLARLDRMANQRRDTLIATLVRGT